MELKHLLGQESLIGILLYLILQHISGCIVSDVTLSVSLSLIAWLKVVKTRLNLVKTFCFYIWPLFCGGETLDSCKFPLAPFHEIDDSCPSHRE